MSARRSAAMAITIGLAVAACSGGTDTTNTVADTTIVSTTSTTTQTPSSTAPPTSSTTTTSEVPVVSDDEVLAAWDQYWAIWAFQRASDPIDRAALEEVASAEVVDGVVAFFEKERESGVGLIIPRVYPSGTVTSIDGDSASLQACTLISRPPTGVPGSLYDVSMQRIDDRWVVDELALVSGAGCVPTDLAASAIAAYEAYWDDRDAFSNPADPDAPWLADRTTGEHFDVMTSLYTDWQERELYFTGRPDTHPEVVEVFPDWSLVILDCMSIPSDWGTYEISSDERTDDMKPVGADGRIDLRSAVMKNEKADDTGEWRVEQLAGEVNASCEVAPTDNALPQS